MILYNNCQTEFSESCTVQLDEICESENCYCNATAADTSDYTEYLCVFTAYRAKLSMLNTVSRIRGQGKSTGYPQTEGMLGECMLLYGQELGAASEFGTIDKTFRTKAR